MRAALLVLALALAGCVQPAPEVAPAADPPAPAANATFALASAAFADQGEIPREHTCDGANESPPLSFTGAPANATTVALLMLDNDVPTPLTPLREVVHWLLWNAPLANGSVEFDTAAVPAGSVQGGESREYRGPCPPLLSPPHRYVFTAHAVAGSLDLAEGATKEELLAALDGRSLATAQLTGTYARALPVR